MVHTNREGIVRAEIGEVDIVLGEVGKTDSEEFNWEGKCALCNELVVGKTKNATVDALEDHFIQAHTTP